MEDQLQFLNSHCFGMAVSYRPWSSYMSRVTCRMSPRQPGVAGANQLPSDRIASERLRAEKNYGRLGSRPGPVKNRAPFAEL